MPLGYCIQLPECGLLYHNAKVLRVLMAFDDIALSNAASLAAQHSVLVPQQGAVGGASSVFALSAEIPLTLYIRWPQMVACTRYLPSLYLLLLYKVQICRANRTLPKSDSQSSPHRLYALLQVPWEVIEWCTEA